MSDFECQIFVLPISVVSRMHAFGAWIQCMDPMYWLSHGHVKTEGGDSVP